MTDSAQSTAKYANLWRTPTGELFYLADTDLRNQYDITAEHFLDQLPSQRPANKILYTDWNDEVVYYADSSSYVQLLSITGYGPIGDADLKRLLEKPYGTSYDLTGGVKEFDKDGKGTVVVPPVEKELLRKYTFSKTISKESGKFEVQYHSKIGKRPYSRTEHGDVKPHLHMTEPPLYLVGESENYHDYVVYHLRKTRGRFSRGQGDVPKRQMGELYAALVAAVKYGKQYWDILDESMVSEELVLSATSEDAPLIPHVNADLFPHQARLLAVLNRSPTALIDADTGAGKTLVSLSDALVQLKEGNANKVAIVMPGAVLAQQKAEMKRFTDNSVNFVIINTQTTNQLGRGKMATLIEDAPKNTIFLVDYGWLARSRTKRPGGGNHFPNSALLTKAGIDMVTLDEVHNIRNGKSLRSQAVMQMAPRLKVKRGMTGTLIPNTPKDVFMQAAFVDPTLFGSYENFLETYAAEYNRNGKVTSWRSNAMKEMRLLLQSKGMVSIRRSNWMYVLPKMVKTFHKVQLSPASQKLYDNIVTDIIDEIKNDPKLSTMLAEFEMAAEGDEGLDFGPLLAKFMPLDQFITNPTVHPLGKKLDEDDQVGPKVAEVDRILSQHFAMSDPGKVIVFTQYKNVARHIIKNSTFKGMMLYYDGAHKSNLQVFKDDPKARVLVAVDVSLREGHNLQVANRIIRVDMTWTPGPVEQSYARIFRPGQKRTVYIDIVTADGTAEITKIARLISKRHSARKLISDYESEANLPVISMNLDNILNFRKWTDLERYVNFEHEMDAQELEEGEELSITQGHDMVDLRTDSVIDKMIIDTPVLKNEPPEYHLSLELLQFSDVWYLVTPETTDTARLVKHKWEHETPYYQHAVANRDEATKLLQTLMDDGLGVNNLRDIQKQLKSKKLTTVPNATVSATVSWYTMNGVSYLALDAPHQDHPLHALLSGYNFQQHPGSYWLKLGKGKNLNRLKRALKNLYVKARFDIDNWHAFVKSAHHLWGVDLHKEYGEQPLTEALEEYVFQIDKVEDRADMDEAIASFEDSGAKMINSFLDTQDNSGRFVVHIPDVKRFLPKFQQTEIYHRVSEVHRQRVHEMANIPHEASLKLLMAATMADDDKVKSQLIELAAQ